VNNNETICALSTPAGMGAIALIRVSGEDAIPVCERLIRLKGGKSGLKDVIANSARLGGFIYDATTIDDVVVTVYRRPHSYTGEDLIEIACHGSKYIQQKVLESLIKNGIRLAKPGEFTQRAFFNGKMDLSQAEAVADLIASESEAAHRFAFNQMRGGFSKEIMRLRDELLHFISLIELELDFSEEDVEFADRSKLSELVDHLANAIEKLLNSFEYGNAIKNGVPVAIIGRTNSGKSTLLNRFLQEERAIVSEIPGTTRDFIEDSITIQGIQFRFIDTAGFRHTTDILENEGIQRSIKKYKQASIVIAVCDINDDVEEIKNILQFLRDDRENYIDKTIIFTINKTDTKPGVELERVCGQYENIWGDIAQVIGISAKQGTGLAKLEEQLLSAINNKSTGSDVTITNVRHFEALEHASLALKRVGEGIKTKLPSDLLAQDIREIMHYLGEINGEISNDEILGNIFKNFCIGK
jgi:tRNA modification GTPase